MPALPGPPLPAAAPAPRRQALAVIGAGVAAALHVGKLPPAVIALQQALGLTLVEAGFLLSLVQLAGMSAGLAFGLLADRLGGRSSMLCGLAVLAVASACGGAGDSAAWLMGWRAIEGCGFLLVVLPAPGLLRRLVPPGQVSATMGLWGAYMPLATALALLSGPVCIQTLGWRGWWWLLAALTVAAAVWLMRAVPVAAHHAPLTGAQTGQRPTQGATAQSWLRPLRLTLGAAGPWLVAATFAMYSGQWLAVIGFLPTIYAQAGLASTSNGLLTALAAAVNMLGNIAAGRLLQRGVAAERLLVTGFLAMAMAAAAAFAGSGEGAGLPPLLRYVAVLVFSGFGGLIPATLFALALRVAPAQAAVSTTVGWVQQWSALGQFGGPPLVAWLASRAGGWQLTWLATGTCSLVGLSLVALLTWRLRAAAPR
ncbi:MAG TPA: MFS transporter [Rubrivivax sp.]|nr:MFS transporter [Rubrivivax sp.]